VSWGDDVRDSDYRRDPERPGVNHGRDGPSCDHQGCSCPQPAARLVGAERPDAQALANVAGITDAPDR
jgi:hypothetical protein